MNWKSFFMGLSLALSIVCFAVGYWSGCRTEAMHWKSENKKLLDIIFKYPPAPMPKRDMRDPFGGDL
jgi:hypothetical protein